MKRDRLVVAIAVPILCALSWLYLISGAGMDMDLSHAAVRSLFPYKTMATAGAAMEGMPGMALPAPAWSLGRWTLATAMWAAMMVAMMTPSASPTLLLYGRVQRTAASTGQGKRLPPTWAFALGYVLVWTVFSIVAAALQLTLERRGLMSATLLGSRSPWLSAAILGVAGVYQLSPLQSACLNHCRSPAAFLTRHWRPGISGAVRLGVLHGAFCLGCCWLLMALLFVGGVMNLVWIAGLTVLVLAEKLFPGGRWIARGAGVLLLAWAVATVTVGI